MPAAKKEKERGELSAIVRRAEQEQARRDQGEQKMDKENLPDPSPACHRQCQPSGIAPGFPTTNRDQVRNTVAPRSARLLRDLPVAFFIH